MIDLRNVEKRYGKTMAIDGLTLSLPDAGIYCLVGRNGAGKTTLMRLVSGRIPATGGQIVVDGQPVNPGRMPEAVTFIDTGASQFNMTVAKLIDAAADLQPGFDKAFAQQMADRFELDPDKRFRKLSFGMKTMLTTIVTAASGAKVLLFDEPTLGFDPVMREQFNALLLHSYEVRPRLIIVSTHHIDEIAKIVEHLIVIDHGRLLLQTSVDDLDERAYALTGPADAVRPLLAGLNCIGQQAIGPMLSAHVFDKRVTPPNGVAVTNLSLQDFFVDLVGGTSHE